MKTKVMRFISGALTALIASSVILSGSTASITANAANNDPLIVVSLGDSFSSGESITPFINTNLDWKQKQRDPDWLAHRSENSWGSKLKFSQLPQYDTLGKYRVPYGTKGTSSVCQWYFAAVSGAETTHLKNQQIKKVQDRLYYGTAFRKVDSVPLSPQLDVFNYIDGDVDYVTMTMGGNDVGFADVIMTVATHSTYFHFGSKSKIENQIDNIKKDFDKSGGTKEKLTQAYRDISARAGKDAHIIIAGYPMLFDVGDHIGVISIHETSIVNGGVDWFNYKLKALIESLKGEMDIEFVDVQNEFSGHGAYASEAWINEIILPAKSEDLECFDVKSAFSMHPNEEGARAYARCINKKIEEIEERDRLKKCGTVAGKVCKASDRITPVANAEVFIFENNKYYTSVKTNEYGQYRIDLPEGNYVFKTHALGYLWFEDYVTVDLSQSSSNYLETYLMIEGSETESGNAKGIIKNALTGKGVDGVKLVVRKGWNNISEGNIVAEERSSESGEYVFNNLPLGNYTVYISKPGFVSNAFNIVVQKSDSGSQDGVISPKGEGNGYRMVLTWGLNPRDLDSHVEGVLSDGNGFHVYYSDMNAYDEEVLVCNLDVDDTTSFGPETVTLEPTTSKPYYYYVYRYDGEGTVATSGAQIKLYKGSELINVFNVPTDLGDGDYWNVFAIKNGELVIRNTMTDSPELSYAE